MSILELVFPYHRIMLHLTYQCQSSKTIPRYYSAGSKTLVILKIKLPDISFPLCLTVIEHVFSLFPQNEGLPEDKL